MRLAWLYVLAAGCFSKPDAPLQDATPSCSDAPFAVTREVPGFADADEEFDANERTDGKELFFSKTNGSRVQLYFAQRGATTEPYASLPVPFAMTNVNETSPSLTRDGFLLLYTSELAGTWRVQEVGRASWVMPWGAPRQVLPDGSGDSIDISPDGLAMYYSHHANGELYYATRSTRMELFTTQKRVGNGIAYHAVSPDELEVYYNDSVTHKLYRQTRATTDDMFANEELVFAEGTDPQISWDGRSMLLGINHSIWVAERNCP